MSEARSPRHGVVRTEDYDDAFFSDLKAGSLRSARIIGPLLVELLRPASAVDVGCGLGAWLLALHEQGIEDLAGLDGPWVPAGARLIPESWFLTTDLTRPFNLNRGFDLAVSLEVAEHLPEASAEGFVSSLAALAPLVYFSAAIPYQGGTNHINEQWPAYWVRRFESRGFDLIDCMRPLIWGNDGVDPWYAQNSLLFVRRTQKAKVLERLGQLPIVPSSMLSVVHPRLHEVLTLEMLAGEE